MLFCSQKRLAKLLSLSADSGVESLNKHKPALHNQAKNSADKNSILDTLNVRSVGQYGRFLPICAKDTLHFWSDVYKLGTRARKAQADLVQGGRSMIEMLGVLAIIGVLSVGGIAGYSKAMTKFKVNKTIDLVSQIAANTRTLFASQKDYNFGRTNSDDAKSLVKKAKIVPDDAIQNGSLKNPFGGDLALNGLDWNFTIELYGIPEDACMELATLDWGAATSSGLNAIAVNEGATEEVKNCSGNADKGVACVGGGTVSVPMPVSLAAQHCSGDNNSISFAFY
jgi:type II secretory pathway pseudopilin PulG